MILMPVGLVYVGLVGADHIEVGHVVEGRIKVNLCPYMALICSAYPGSAGDPT